CAPSWKSLPHDRVFQRTVPAVKHRRPASDLRPSDWWDIALHTTVIPLGQLVSPARYIDRIRGGRRALDVNDFGKVPDSTWFVNRIGKRPMTAREVARGPGENRGPASGLLTVVSGKLEGATPGVIARDAAGVTWF